MQVVYIPEEDKEASLGLTFCFYNLLGLVMFFYNFVTLIFGIALTAIGGAMYTKENKLFNELLEYARNRTAKLVSQIPTVLPAQYTTLDFPLYEVEVLAKNAAIAFISIGVFFLCASLLGLCLSRKSGRCLVLIYTIYVVLLTTSVVCLFSLARPLVIKDMKETLDEYKGLADPTLKGKTWNAIMLGLGCCGVEGFEDFKNHDSWPPSDIAGYTVDERDLSAFYLGKNITLNNATLGELNCSATNGGKISCEWFDSDRFETPMACCKSLTNISDSCHVKGVADDANNWLSLGCSTKVMNYLTRQEDIYGLFSILLVFMASYCAMLMIRVWRGVDLSSPPISPVTRSKTPTPSSSSSSLSSGSW